MMETKVTTWLWMFPTRYDCIWTELLSHIPQCECCTQPKHSSLLSFVCRNFHSAANKSVIILVVCLLDAFLLPFMQKVRQRIQREKGVTGEWKVCVCVSVSVQACMSIFIFVCTWGLGLFDLHVHASGFPPVCLLSVALSLSHLTL